MKSRSLLTTTFVLVIIFGLLHYMASVFYFYWTLWWFDNLMHFLGGLSLGLFTLWLGQKFSLIGRDSSPRRTVLYTVAVVLIIGIGWEVFEYVYGLTDATESKYYMDVVHDLISDTLGAIGAYLWAGRSSEYSTMRSNG